jgi:hypothetical protein
MNSIIWWVGLIVVIIAVLVSWGFAKKKQEFCLINGPFDGPSSGPSAKRWRAAMTFKTFTGAVSQCVRVVVEIESANNVDSNYRFDTVRTPSSRTGC